MLRAYIDGLKMLGRRELSEAQVRQRLARREHSDDDIDAAVARLKDERALDDVRVAEAIARTQLAIRGRGRLRVRQEIERAGIGKALARQAVDAAFAEVDDDQLLETALLKRLHGRTVIADDREQQRLYRFLISQGFDADRIIRALRARRPR
jgi:regulatory protein